MTVLICAVVVGGGVCDVCERVFFVLHSICSFKLWFPSPLFPFLPPFSGDCSIYGFIVSFVYF